MTYEGTAWECRLGVCLVVRDLGRSEDGTSYMEVLLLDHVQLDVVGATLVACDIEKHWRPL